MAAAAGEECPEAGSLRIAELEAHATLTETLGPLQLLITTGSAGEVTTIAAKTRLPCRLQIQDHAMKAPTFSVHLAPTDEHVAVVLEPTVLPWQMMAASAEVTDFRRLGLAVVYTLTDALPAAPPKSGTPCQVLAAARQVRKECSNPEAFADVPAWCSAFQARLGGSVQVVVTLPKSFGPALTLVRLTASKEYRITCTACLRMFATPAALASSPCCIHPDPGSAPVRLLRCTLNEIFAGKRAPPQPLPPQQPNPVSPTLPASPEMPQHMRLQD